MNVKEGNIIAALNDLPLHLVNCCRAPCHTEVKLRCPPILFYKVEFTMVFGIEIAQMPARLNQLLKLRLLRDKIRLKKENTPAITVSTTRGAMKARTLGENISLRPQTTLPNDDLHAFEPARHGGVVIREIK